MPKNKIWELVSKKLSGEATITELKELEDLLRNNPDLHYPMQTVADLWHQNAADKEDAYAAYSRHSSRMKEMGVDFEYEETMQELLNTDHNNISSNAGNNRKKYMLLLLSSFVLVFLGYYSYNKFFPSPDKTASRILADKSEVSTKYGSRTKLVLPDGTQVWLNAGSKLSYDKNYGNSIREVALSGEAYFDVIRNPSHPFIIHTEKIDIKVLGTAFNVKSYPGEKNTETSLIRGSIEVTVKDRPTEKIILKPNEKLVIANNDMLKGKPLAAKTKFAINDTPEPIVAVSHLTYEPKDSTVLETSWMVNKLIFRSETFEDLSVKMERWYGITFRFADENIKKKKFTGVFENESIQQALEALKLTTSFTCRFNKKEVTIASK
jgi:transmembrane sensor